MRRLNGLLACSREGRLEADGYSVGKIVLNQTDMQKGKRHKLDGYTVEKVFNQTDTQ